MSEKWKQISNNNFGCQDKHNMLHIVVTVASSETAKDKSFSKVEYETFKCNIWIFLSLLKIFIQICY